MQLITNGGELSLNLTAKEFESLAVFLANFSDEEVVNKVGHDCGTRVNNIANTIAPMIISSKEME